MAKISNRLQLIKFVHWHFCFMYFSWFLGFCLSNYTSRNKIGICLRIKTVKCLVMSFFFSFSGDRGKATLNKNQLYPFHMQHKIIYIYIYIYKKKKREKLFCTPRGPHRKCLIILPINNTVSCVQINWEHNHILSYNLKIIIFKKKISQQ